VSLAAISMSSLALRGLRVRALGRCEYGAALAEQEAQLADVVAGADERLLLVEHPPVYTLGRGADAGDLRDAPEQLGVPVYRIGRGGGATFHGPGQMVGYPIVRLRGGGRDVHGYVRALEQALIDTCAAYGVEAAAPAGQTGVWVGERKVGSIGIGVRRGVAWHGVALNVATDLRYFDAITVCRSAATRLVNLSELVDRPLTVESVGARFAQALATRLDRRLEDAPWP